MMQRLDNDAISAICGRMDELIKGSLAVAAFERTQDKVCSSLVFLFFVICSFGLNYFNFRSKSENK